MEQTRPADGGDPLQRYWVGGRPGGWRTERGEARIKRKPPADPAEARSAGGS